MDVFDFSPFPSLPGLVEKKKKKLQDQPEQLPSI